MIGLVAATAAGRAQAQRLAAAWPERTRQYDAPVAKALPQAWAECDQIVAFLAVGAAVRLVAPLLDDKHTDPGLVCVDEAGRHAVAVLGGHSGGANGLAAAVAQVLDAQPVVTTATDATGLPGLDDLGWPVEGAVAAVTRALLDGAPVRLDADATWPLPALPAHVTPDAQAAAHLIRITDRRVPADDSTVVLRPPSLVVGVGASRGVSTAEVLDLIDTALAQSGLAPASVRHVATVDAKADEAGIVAACAARGWPLVTYPAALLATITVPNPSEVVQATLGTPSVAEAAALAADSAAGNTGSGGPAGAGGAELVVQKRKSAMATVAIARHGARGRLAVIGLGPGARDLLTPRAVAAMRAASVVVGLDQYVAQVQDLLRPGTRVLASGLGDEEARARTAVEQAQRGHAVALIGSGDAGVYAMASPALAQADSSIDVDVVPGVTAALAASALLGAPLGHDHAAISLSDLHTPWPIIERRITGAAAGDFVVTFYNPRSRGRDWQLPAALHILRKHRPDRTPVGVVRQAYRHGQQVAITTLGELDPAVVDMLTVVVVGASATRVVAGRMVTPRGYRWGPL